MTPKERPILFSGPMVRAILEGRKHQTRRVMKQQSGPELAFQNCPFGVVGDLLWVRETWAYHLCCGEDVEQIHFRADGDCCATDGTVIRRWRPSIFMPKIASRITLEITGVGVERLQNISEEDAQAEGITPPSDWMDYDCRKKYDAIMKAEGTSHFQTGFRLLWDSINAKRGFGWDVNPWVWVIEFREIYG